MDAFRRQVFLNVFKLFDGLVMVFSFALTVILVCYHIEPISLIEFFSMRFKVQNFILFLGLLWAWYYIFTLCGLYNSRRFSRGREEIFDVIKGTSLGTLTILITAIFFKISIINHVFLLIFWFTVTAITIVGRLTLRYVLALIRSGVMARGSSRILLIPVPRIW